MLKKMMSALFFIFTFSSVTVAQGFEKAPVKLLIRGDVESVYKNQTDYVTMLDSKDRVDDSYKELVPDDRDGANNRSSQKARATGGLTLVAMTNHNGLDNSNSPPKLLAVSRIQFRPNDPDVQLDEKPDGAYSDNLLLGETWIRYSPIAPIGIKIGNQTVLATSNTSAIGHRFLGDIDFDFIWYTASIVARKPGLTMDLHLGKDIEFGIGQLQGMSGMSRVAVGGDYHEAENTVFWFNGKFSPVSVTFGYQSVAIGGTKTDSDDISSYNHEFQHTVMNLAARFNLGNFQPFLGVQSVAGEQVVARRYDQYDQLMQSLSASNLPVQRLSNKLGNRDVAFSIYTAGLLYQLGGSGIITMEYSTVDSPGWGEEKYATSMTEADNSMHLHYEYPLSKGTKLTLFYNALNTKKDQNLRADIEKMDANAQVLPETVATALELPRQITSLAQATSTTSMGVSLQMKFGI